MGSTSSRWGCLHSRAAAEPLSESSVRRGLVEAMLHTRALTHRRDPRRCHREGAQVALLAQDDMSEYRPDVEHRDAPRSLSKAATAYPWPLQAYSNSGPWRACVAAFL